MLQQVGTAFVLQQAYDDGDEATPGPLDPPIAATLVASADRGPDRRHRGPDHGRRAVLPRPAAGCAAWPEAATQVSGPVAEASTPYEQTKGYLDAHLHLMSFEFLGGKVICGRPWHPYGIKPALTDCPDHGPGGYGSALEDVVSGKNPGSGHETDGYPTFSYWPNYNSLTHQQVYYKWLRAVLARRAADVHRPAGAERPALRALPAEEGHLRRDGHGPPRGRPQPSSSSASSTPRTAVPAAAGSGSSPTRCRPAR